MKDLFVKRLNLFLVFTAIISFILYSNCSLDEPEDDRRKVIGEGPVVKQVIQADTFNIFSHLSIGNVNITTGDSLEIYVKAQQNILDEMMFDFEDEYFGWGLKEDIVIEDADTILLTINMPNALEAIQIGGAGTVNIRGNKQDHIYYEILGFSEVDSYLLEVDSINVNIAGFAKCRFRVNNVLSGLISGSGTIYYKGDPRVNVAIVGQGEVIDDN